VSGPSPSAADGAATIALQALAHLAGSDALSARFLRAAGIAPADIAARVADPEFLAAVLDFYLADEPALVDFATRAQLDPGAVVAARQALPGGVLPHWT